MKKFVILAIVAGTLIFQLYAKPLFREGRRPEYASYLRGLMAERYKDNKKALQEFVKAKAIDKESDTLQLKIAIEQIKQGKNEEAIKVLSDISGTENINLDAYLLLILMHSTQGQEEEANKAYNQLLEKLYKSNNEDMQVAESIAKLRIEENNIPAAIDVYLKILEKEPENQNALFWLGYLYEQTGSIDNAIESWERLIEINPDHSNALNSLGYVYAEKGIKLDEAEKLILKALDYDSDSPAYLDSLGWVYFKQGRYKDAKRHIERAVVNFTDPVIFDHLGDVYFKLGKSKKALEQWQKAQELDPENSLIKNKIRKEAD